VVGAIGDSGEILEGIEQVREEFDDGFPFVIGQKALRAIMGFLEANK
jgi:hypothetical protein